MTTKFYVEMFSFWENAPSYFFGPYTAKDDAEYAIDNCDAVRMYNLARDVKTQLRARVLTATEARRNGMCESNRFYTTLNLPNDTQELHDLVENLE